MIEHAAEGLELPRSGHAHCFCEACLTLLHASFIRKLSSDRCSVSSPRLLSRLRKRPHQCDSHKQQCCADDNTKHDAKECDKCQLLRLREVCDRVSQHQDHTGIQGDQNGRECPHSIDRYRCGVIAVIVRDMQGLREQLQLIGSIPAPFNTCQDQGLEDIVVGHGIYGKYKSFHDTI